MKSQYGWPLKHYLLLGTSEGVQVDRDSQIEKSGAMQLDFLLVPGPYLDLHHKVEQYKLLPPTQPDPPRIRQSGMDQMSFKNFPCLHALVQFISPRYSIHRLASNPCPPTRLKKCM